MYKRGRLEELRPLFSSLDFWVHLSYSSRVYYPLFFLIKLRCNTDSSFVSNFCCGETELRKLQTPPTLHIHKRTQFLYKRNFIFLL